MESQRHVTGFSHFLHILSTAPRQIIEPGSLQYAHQWELLSFLLGIALHLGLFRRGEWDLAAGSICKAYAATVIFISGLLLVNNWVQLDLNIQHVFTRSCSILFAHLIGLLVSICTYRYWFHPLRNFPGPSLSPCSSLYMLLLSLKKHQSEFLEEYHRVYGDYVRTCPNKLSITDPIAIAALYGRSSPVSKGPFSGTTHPRANLNMCRDKAEHARRRKFWDRALSTSSLRGRTPIIRKHADRLLDQLQARAGEVVDVTKWLGLFSFDVLFDIGFGQDKKCTISGHEDFYMSCAQQILKITGLVMHAPWMMYFVSWSPTLSARFGKFRDLSADIVNDRLAKPGDREDLFSIISRSYDELERKSPQDFENLAGDADLLVLAGADSIAAAISNILYELTVNPAEQDKLREALAEVEDLEDLQTRGNLRLDAIIHESLRLNPPAPAGHERITPPEGLRIGDHFIPGNVSVFMPHYTLFRDPRFFDQPTTFIPERWTTRPELNKDAGIVFFPFQTGRNVCPGRVLALMEIRTVVFMIISRFTVEPASADIKAKFIGGRDDRWLLAVGELSLVLRNLKRA